MKCPKCHYLSFEPEPQCRNCGYNLELAAADLRIEHDEAADEPFADLELRAAGDDVEDVVRDTEGDVAHVEEPPVWAPHRSAAEPPARQTKHAVAAAAQDDADVDETGLPPIRRPAVSVRTVTPPPAAPRAEDQGLPPPRRPARSAPTTELPLFVKDMPAATGGGHEPSGAPPPRVRVPQAPRPPVAVQRRATDSGRTRSQPVPAQTPAQPQTQPEAQPLTKIQVQTPTDADAAVSRSAAPARLAAPPPERPAPGVPAETGAARRPEGRRPGGSFGRDLLQDLERLDRMGRQQEPATPRRARAADEAFETGVAASTRLAAAAIDGAFLGTISLAVFWLTLRWCGLELRDALLVPVVPIATFVLLIALGYLLMFTAAGGQTIGKMACGLRVIDALEDGRPAGPVSPRQAFVRAVLTLPSVLALGAGFMPALVGEGRAFHDRLAQTRVVRA